MSRWWLVFLGGVYVLAQHCGVLSFVDESLSSRRERLCASDASELTSGGITGVGLLWPRRQPIRSLHVVFDAGTRALFHVDVATSGCEDARLLRFHNAVCSQLQLRAGSPGFAECNRFVTDHVFHTNNESCRYFPRATEAVFSPKIHLPSQREGSWGSVPWPMCVLRSVSGAPPALFVSAQTRLAKQLLRSTRLPAAVTRQRPAQCHRPLRVVVGVLSYSWRTEHWGRWERLLERSGAEPPRVREYDCWQMRVEVHVARPNGTFVRMSPECGTALARAVGSGGDGASVASERFQRLSEFVSLQCPGSIEEASHGGLLVVSHPGELGRLFAFQARAALVRQDADMLAFFEEDHDLTLEHLRAHWHWSDVLPEGWTPGLMQYEQVGGSRHLIGGALFHNNAFFLYELDSDILLVHENAHQGGFIVKRGALLECLRRRHQRLFQPHWFYPVIEVADSELFFRCNVTRAVPLPLVRRGLIRPGFSDHWLVDDEPSMGPLHRWRASFAIHHTPDKYVQQEGTERPGTFGLKDTDMIAWASRCS
jgi:hypothetical protein